VGSTDRPAAPSGSLLGGGDGHRGADDLLGDTRAVQPAAELVRARARIDQRRGLQPGLEAAERVGREHRHLIRARRRARSREELGKDSPVIDTLGGVIMFTVLLSVFAHGISAAPLATRYGQWVTRTHPPIEGRPSAEPMPSRGRGGR